MSSALLPVIVLLTLVTHTLFGASSHAFTTLLLYSTGPVRIIVVTATVYDQRTLPLIL